MQTRTCTKCHETKLISEFTYYMDKLHLKWWCKQCIKKKNREYLETHREELSIKRHLKLKSMRQSVINKYGGCCSCCGETEPEFLAIDHILGNGAAERKLIGSNGILLKLYKVEQPLEGYRILCHNCNLAIAYCGACPHARL